MSVKELRLAGIIFFLSTKFVLQLLELFNFSGKTATVTAGGAITTTTTTTIVIIIIISIIILVSVT